MNSRIRRSLQYQQSYPQSAIYTVFIRNLNSVAYIRGNIRGYTHPRRAPFVGSISCWGYSRLVFLQYVLLVQYAGLDTWECWRWKLQFGEHHHWIVRRWTLDWTSQDYVHSVSLKANSHMQCWTERFDTCRVVFQTEDDRVCDGRGQFSDGVTTTSSQRERVKRRPPWVANPGWLEYGHLLPWKFQILIHQSQTFPTNVLYVFHVIR